MLVFYLVLWGVGLVVSGLVCGFVILLLRWIGL